MFLLPANVAFGPLVNEVDSARPSGANKLYALMTERHTSLIQ
jgi:hypothetical protein